MNVEMKIATHQYDEGKFNQLLDDLKNDVWEVKREYGGAMPNFYGHGAELSKSL